MYVGKATLILAIALAVYVFDVAADEANNGAIVGSTLDRAMGTAISNIQRIVIDMGADYNDEPVSNYMKYALAQPVANDSTAGVHAGARGDPRLRQSIARFYSRVIRRQLDGENEVITTIGATEALASTIRAFSKPGDQWILIQPFYNMFKTAVELAYAVPRYANLKPARNIHESLSANDWKLDRHEMRSLINRRTKGIIFNNPNNPLGKVYTREEMDFIAQLAKSHNLIVISDEVHEFTTDSMIKMVSLPGMFGRTLTIGSASKAFDAPGWRVGWVIGPKVLIDRIHEVHENTVGFDPPAQQRAIAKVFEDEILKFGTSASRLNQHLASLKQKRNFFVNALQRARVPPIVPSGGNCMLAGWWVLGVRQFNFGTSRDDLVVSCLSKVAHIRVFPADKYFGNNKTYEGDNELRFCYNKRVETLRNAAAHLLWLDTNQGVLCQGGNA